MPDGWELGIEKAQRSALVSVVAVNYNGLHLLKQSLPSIAAQDYPLHEVTIVDNASIDNSVQYITESFPTYRCLRSKTNLHYTRAMNLGIRESRGDLLLLINNDVVLDPSCPQHALGGSQASGRRNLRTENPIPRDPVDSVRGRKAISTRA